MLNKKAKNTHLGIFFVLLLFKRSKMAKPINITPVLRGSEASRFFKKLKINKSKIVEKSLLTKINEDAKLLLAITKD